MKTLFFSILAIAGFLVAGNDPIGATAMISDWDGFPEYNIIGVAVFFVSVFVLSMDHDFDLEEEEDV